MTTNPEPMNAGIGRQAQSSVVETNPHAVESATGQKLELQRRMRGIDLQQGEILISESLDALW